MDGEGQDAASKLGIWDPPWTLENLWLCLWVSVFFTAIWAVVWICLQLIELGLRRLSKGSQKQSRVPAEST